MIRCQTLLEFYLWTLALLMGLPDLHRLTRHMGYHFFGHGHLWGMYEILVHDRSLQLIWKRQQQLTWEWLGDEAWRCFGDPFSPCPWEVSSSPSLAAWLCPPEKRPGMVLGVTKMGTYHQYVAMFNAEYDDTPWNYLELFYFLTSPHDIYTRTHCFFLGGSITHESC